MKFVIVCLLFIGCVAAATNSSSSTGESSTGVSSESSSTFNTSSSTGLFSSSSDHNATFSSSGGFNTSSTGQASSTGVWSSTGSTPTPPESCFSSSTYGNTSIVGTLANATNGYTLINNNTYITEDGWITSISVVYHETSPSHQILLIRATANPNNTYSPVSVVTYSAVDAVNITGLTNSTEVQTVNVTIAVKKGDFLGLFSSTGVFGLNGLTDGYAWCSGVIGNNTGCFWTETQQVRIGFTLNVEVPCTSSSTGVAPNTTSSSSSSSAPNTTSSSSSSSASNNTSSTGPTYAPPTRLPSSSTGGAPTQGPQPEPEEASTSKSITATGFVVGAASMLGVALLVVGACWYVKRNQRNSTMNSPLLSHA